MYRGSINTRTKPMPVAPGLPFIRTYALACTIMVFDEGFMTIRANWMNDMTALILHHSKHAGAAAAMLDRFGASYANPTAVFSLAKERLTPEIVRSTKQFAELPLVTTTDVFQAWIQPDSIFRRRDPYAMGILAHAKEWRVSLLSKVHIIVGDATRAEQLLQQVLPPGLLTCKVQQ